MRNRVYILFFSLLLGAAAPAPLAAQQARPDGAAAESGGQAAVGQLPPDTTTRHTVTIDGEQVRYSATAGTITLRGEERQPTGEVFYVAYTRDGVQSKDDRPVTFVYNGGPGSASVWLHLGALGPRRVVTEDTAHTSPPPYHLVPNGHSPLDETDLVFIDPVGTGYSRTLGDTKGQHFWGVDEDARSVGQFIRRYLDQNHRWNSPRYLLGESYGTTRSAVVVNYLQSERSVDFNGVALVSMVLNFQTIGWAEGNELPYALYLPSYAATAWYHDALPNSPEDLAPLLDEVREFADDEYADALRAGASLDSARRARIVDRLHRYTGLSEDYIRKADLRIDNSMFEKELKREHNVVLGRLDARFTGPGSDQLGKEVRYDPGTSSIGSAFATAFRTYIQEELGYQTGRRYAFRGDVRPWDWSRGRSFGWPGYTDAAPDLARAMRRNPDLDVLVLNGYYDLATPFHAAEHTVRHLNIPDRLRDNITMEYYDAGHMMYLHTPALEKMHDDLEQLIE